MFSEKTVFLKIILANIFKSKLCAHFIQHTRVMQLPVLTKCLNRLPIIRNVLLYDYIQFRINNNTMNTC